MSQGIQIGPVFTRLKRSNLYPTLVKNWAQIPKKYQENMQKNPMFHNECTCVFYGFFPTKTYQPIPSKMIHIHIPKAFPVPHHSAARYKAVILPQVWWSDQQIAVAPIAFSRILDVHGWRTEDDWDPRVCVEMKERFEVQGTGGNLDCPVLPCPSEIRRLIGRKTSTTTPSLYRAMIFLWVSIHQMSLQKQDAKFV